jgi:hypothetical protein
MHEEKAGANLKELRGEIKGKRAKAEARQKKMEVFLEELRTWIKR